MIAEGNPTRIRGLTSWGCVARPPGTGARGTAPRLSLALSRRFQYFTSAGRQRQEGFTSLEVQRLITFVEGAKRGICGGSAVGENVLKMKGLMTMSECVGLVAGEGELPAIVVRAMLARGLDIVAIALSEPIYAQLQPFVQRLHCFGAGQGTRSSRR